MEENLKNKIVVSFYEAKPNYERLAKEILRFFEIHPDFPKDSVYTITHRIKNKERLIEKIDEKNKKRKPTSLINSKNYQDEINDILGMRIICFCHSDVEKVAEYLSSLNKEGKLKFVCGPEKKQPPLLWITNPKEEAIEIKDIQYSGYSSIHYVIKPGKASTIPKELSSLRCEIQVRTILEDAWGEIDHKYRYEITRKGFDIPSHIDRGFRFFSAYIQVLSVQTEYLCRDIEDFIDDFKRLKHKPTILPSLPSAPPKAKPNGIAEVLRQEVGFTPTKRIVEFVESQMFDAGFDSNLPESLKEKVLTKKVKETFKQIYREIMGKEPFVNPNDRDIDLMNLLNYSLTLRKESQDVANESLRAILKLQKIGF